MSEKNPTAKPFTVRIYDDDIERFNHIASEMDVETNGGAFRKLLDFYQNPPSRIVRDNPEQTQRIATLEAEAEARTNTITDLQAKLKTAEELANKNGETGTQLQLRIEQLEAENKALKEGKQHSPYYVGGDLHPVAYYYLQKMAEMQSKTDKQERTPFWIMSNNFIMDLQNPRSNHLPMIVSSDDMRKKLAEYKKSQEQPKNEE